MPLPTTPAARHKRYLRGGVICLLFALSIFPSRAAKAELTWEQCVEESRRSNPDLAAAEAAVRNAEALHRAAYSPFLPQISASLGFTRGNTSVPGLAPTPSRDVFSAGVNATEQLFSGFRDRARLKGTSANVDAAVGADQLQKAKLTFELKSAFSSALYSQELYALTERIVERRATNLRLVTLRYEGGRENKGSFLLSQASLTQAEFERAQAKRAISVAKRQLARALGRADDSPIEVAGTLSTSAPPESPDFRSLATSTPDHRQAEAQFRSARGDTSVAYSALYPEVSLTGFVGRQGESFFPEQSRWSVGVNVSWPFFPGGANLFNIQAALANERKVELTLTSLDAGLVVKLEQAHSAFVDAVGNRSVADQFLKAAVSRSTIAAGKYTTGMMTFEDWDIIENDRINREKAALQTRRDAVIAEATWMQAQGRGAFP